MSVNQKLNESGLDSGEKKTWISIYGLLLTVATAGNVFVAWFIIGNQINRLALSAFVFFY